MARRHAMNQMTPNQVRLEGDAAYLLLAGGEETIVDAADLQKIAAYRWSAKRHEKCTYAQATGMNGGVRTTVRLHRLILDAQPGQFVDHIDHDGLNNRRTNLRECSPAQSVCNRRLQSNNTSGFKGVSYNPSAGRWYARAKVDRKIHYLGGHATAEAAARAYDSFVSAAHGAFAVLNMPSHGGQS